MNWRRVLTITRKEFLVLLGNRASRFLIIVPPLLQIVIFGWAATMEVRNVKVAYVNHDAGLWSKKILHRLEGSPTFERVVEIDGEQGIARELNGQKSLFILVFNQEFSRNIEKGKPAEMQILMDGTRSNAAQIAASYVNKIIQSIIPDTPGAIETARELPQLDIRYRYWFNPNLNFQWFFLPNLIGMLSLMIGLVVTGLSVAREREAGTFDQLLVSPATPTEIAVAKLIPGVCVGMIHGTIFLLISVFGFGVPFNGSVLILYLGMLVFAFSSGGIGLMISSISSTQQQAFLGSFALGVPSILISGAVTPIINMPKSLQYASQFNPIRHFTTLCQGVFLKDITLPAALLNIGKIAAISLFCVSIAVWMFKKKR